MLFRPIRHGRCDSTNQRALAALESGDAQHGDVHLALEQTSGRGRLGRRWHSAPGEGLYLSVVLKPQPPASPGLPLCLTMAGGLAVLDLARGLGLAGAALKWPNDVLVAGAKLSGVLVESRGFDPSAPSFVLGIGVNVEQRQFPAELLAERPVTSLWLCGARAPVAEVETRLLGVLAGLLEQALGAEASGAPARLAARFALELGLLGRPVAIERGPRRQLGRLLDLTLEHAELEGPAGRERIPLAHISALTAAEAGAPAIEHRSNSGAPPAV
jgi:BirA family biotin operon repressor/biotin-[acetyl-CoA-carboxylase] ligase